MCRLVRILLTEIKQQPGGKCIIGSLTVIIQSRRMRLAKNLVLMGETGSLYKVLVVKPEEKIVKILCTCPSHEAIHRGRGTAANRRR